MADDRMPTSERELVEAEALSEGPLPTEVVEQRRDLSADVRRFLSLGIVLRSRLV